MSTEMKPEYTRPLITEPEWGRLLDLRAKLFAEIKTTLAEDGHCKSYEGTFEIKLPNYFEDEGGEGYRHPFGIVLHCYVVGGSRHHLWSGKTFTACLDQAEGAILSWIRDNEQQRREDA